MYQDKKPAVTEAQWNVKGMVAFQLMYDGEFQYSEINPNIPNANA